MRATELCALLCVSVLGCTSQGAEEGADGTKDDGGAATSHNDGGDGGIVAGDGSVHTGDGTEGGSARPDGKHSACTPPSHTVVLQPIEALTIGQGAPLTTQPMQSRPFFATGSGNTAKADGLLED